MDISEEDRDKISEFVYKCMDHMIDHLVTNFKMTRKEAMKLIDEIQYTKYVIKDGS